jgi:hypothetical protein
MPQLFTRLIQKRQPVVDQGLNILAEFRGRFLVCIIIIIKHVPFLASVITAQQLQRVTCIEGEPQLLTGGDIEREYLRVHLGTLKLLVPQQTLKHLRVNVAI